MPEEGVAGLFVYNVHCRKTGTWLFSILPLINILNLITHLTDFHGFNCFVMEVEAKWKHFRVRIQKHVNIGSLAEWKELDSRAIDPN
jgi:hypothetical protein